MANYKQWAICLTAFAARAAHLHEYLIDDDLFGDDHDPWHMARGIKRTLRIDSRWFLFYNHGTPIGFATDDPAIATRFISVLDKASSNI